MTIDIDNFLYYQEAMLVKTVAMMRHVWYRGAITIITRLFRVPVLQIAPHTMAANGASAAPS